MEYFLAISNRENSDIVKEKNVWGVSKSHVNKISKAKIGDRLLIYVGQQVVDKDTRLPSAITGCYEIISPVYEDSTPLFKSPAKLGNQIFPLRIKLKPVRIFNDEVDFKQLIPKLNFIVNKKQWSGHIRGQAMRTIPEEDYEYIMKAAATPRG